eukprot:TRINITY_DN27044_c0_g1_i1.p1 TRINITY_DN27044_c0_g1~~TRINITY_DN27044_c0_g1_i1.p1  ORF type:complete len:1787 (-),score=468.00 TRINITY_DN27044_c0_g1_i1:64-4899(-)
MDVAGAEPELQTSLELKDIPERWMKIYHAHPELLTRGERVWTEEEHECEAQWIYKEIFEKEGKHEMPPTLDATIKILKLLHFQKLEPMHVQKQYAWQFQKTLYSQDTLLIAEADQQWQGIWCMYKKVCDWLQALDASQTQVPDYLKAKMNRAVFENKGAELDIKDAFDFLTVTFPNTEVDPASLSCKSSEERTMAAVRKHRFDEKLGVAKSLDPRTLSVFGITPDELGQNLSWPQAQAGGLPHQSVDGNDELNPTELCVEHIAAPDFTTGDSVKEAITLFLSRLIACEPRVRKFVRGKFMEMCAVSTKVTPIGRPAAEAAAKSFKASYRAFHVTNRPLDLFVAEECLFLECLNLERQGFITIEYSLIERTCVLRKKPPSELKEEERYSYKLVDLGRDEQGVSVDKDKIKSQASTIVNKSALTEAELSRWEHVEELHKRLEAVAKAHEIMSRRTSAPPAEQASAMYNCAKMNIGVLDLQPMLVKDPIYTEMIRCYCYKDVLERNEYVQMSDWNAIRKAVLLRALRDELYPMMWQEAQARLIRQEEKVVAKLCAQKLTKIVDVQPYCLTDQEVMDIQAERQTLLDSTDPEAGLNIADDDDFQQECKLRRAGLVSVLVVVPISSKENDMCAVALVNPYGDPVELRVLYRQFYEKDSEKDELHKPNSYLWLRVQKRREHRELFKKMLKNPVHTPAVVVIQASDRDVRRCQEELQDMINQQDKEDPFIIKPMIVHGDPTIPRVVAYHPRLQQEGAYRDCPDPAFRVAVSAARLLQDPLAEAVQLWSDDPDENGFLGLDLHRLQSVLPRERLMRALLVPIMETVAKSGLHLNRMRRSAHLLAPAMFAPGLGPLKAEILRKCILADHVTSRGEFARRFVQYLRVDAAVERDPTQSPVMANLLPFLKICPDKRDDPRLVDEIPGLDLLRFGESYVPWLESLCRAALRRLSEPVDEDTDVVKRCVELHRNGRHNIEKEMNEVELASWGEMAGREVPEGIDGNSLLEDFVREIKQPYEDQRQEFQKMDENRIFYLSTGTTEDSLSIGSLVQATVRQDMEVEDAGKAASDKRYMVKCVTWPSRLPGTFRKRERGEMGKTFPNCEREFKQDETVLCRISEVMHNRRTLALSVDMSDPMWHESFPIKNEVDACHFVPAVNEDWNTAKLGLVDSSGDIAKRELKAWVDRPRNIRHANWVNGDHNKCVNIMDACPVNSAIFRSSRHHDLIVALLKVRETRGETWVPAKECFRTFDVYELGEKTTTKGFEIAKELVVDGINYDGLDEIIARHMDPISDNLRALQEHYKFGLGRGEVFQVSHVREGIKSMAVKDPRALHYAMTFHPKLPGHGLLMWTMGTHKVREDLIEITPKGFLLWSTFFSNIPDMLQWFKKVGWRNSSNLRKKHDEMWKRRCDEAKAKRGVDVREGQQEAPIDLNATNGQYLGSGLNTPGGAGGMNTPTAYGRESAAPTPGGLVTPGNRQVPSTPGGMMTPRFAAPSTPRFAAPSTPSGLVGQSAAVSPFPGNRPVPSTPGGLKTPRFAAPSTPRFAAPSTPAGLVKGMPAPTTPAGAYARPEAMPAPTTPFGLTAQAMPAPTTPFGLTAQAMPAPTTPFGLTAQEPAAKRPRTE